MTLMDITNTTRCGICAGRSMTVGAGWVYGPSGGSCRPGSAGSLDMKDWDKSLMINASWGC
jgi:hypothetical protein